MCNKLCFGWGIVLKRCLDELVLGIVHLNFLHGVVFACSEIVWSVGM